MRREFNIKAIEVDMAIEFGFNGINLRIEFFRWRTTVIVISGIDTLTIVIIIIITGGIPMVATILIIIIIIITVSVVGVLITIILLMMEKYLIVLVLLIQIEMILTMLENISRVQIQILQDTHLML